MQHLSQCGVVGESDVGKSQVETGNRTAIHFVVLSVATVHLDDSGLVTKGIGVRRGATQGLSPIGGKPFHMLGMEAVAESVSDYLVGHHPMMPGGGKPAQAIVATRCLEDSLHTSHNGNQCESLQDRVFANNGCGEFSRGDWPILNFAFFAKFRVGMFKVGPTSVGL